MVSVIGESWLKLSDEYGRRKIDHPDDWVRLKLISAFERGVPVIPVLLEEPKIPVMQAIDGELVKLCSAQAQRI
jgi:hypothetical protein